MKRLLLSLTIIFILSSCAEPSELVGLWKLEDVSVDMIPRKSTPIFLKFDPSGSFSVSRAIGDLIGLYQLKENDLYFSSNDKKWFNTNWNANVYQGILVAKRT
ncbi:hypothetical protein [Ekhidna sp. To15]|uniref:hypothetical protein n=1 Tax=Ekhidna sp. To15 TaxID=3395267 RepID=UPI003F51E8CD